MHNVSAAAHDNYCQKTYIYRWAINIIFLTRLHARASALLLHVTGESRCCIILVLYSPPRSLSPDLFYVIYTRTQFCSLQFVSADGILYQHMHLLISFSVMLLSATATRSSISLHALQKLIKLQLSPASRSCAVISSPATISYLLPKTISHTVDIIDNHDDRYYTRYNDEDH